MNLYSSVKQTQMAKKRVCGRVAVEKRGGGAKCKFYVLKAFDENKNLLFDMFEKPSCVGNTHQQVAEGQYKEFLDKVQRFQFELSDDQKLFLQRRMNLTESV